MHILYNFTHEELKQNTNYNIISTLTMLFFNINKKWYVIDRPKYPKNAKLVDEKRPYLTISSPTHSISHVWTAADLHLVREYDTRKT